MQNKIERQTLPLVIFLSIYLSLSGVLAQPKYDLYKQLYPPFVKDDRLNEAFGWSEPLPTQKDSNVTLLGRWAWGHCYAVAAQGHYAYISNGGAFQVLDISNPAMPTLIGEVTLPDLILGITLAENFAYVADWAAGMRIVDISQPTEPVEVGFYRKGRIHNIAVQGNYAYLADDDGNLLIVDISLPNNPIEVGSFSNPGAFLEDVAVAGNYAYLVGDYGTLGLMVIVDISVPANPTRVKSIGLNGTGTSATISENKLYVTSAWGYVGGGGLVIFDLSAPDDPKDVIGFRSDEPIWDVALSGQYAFVMEGDNVGIEVFDVLSSTVVARFDTKVFAVDGAITGNYLCVADFVDFNVIDISAPTFPKLTGEFDTGYFAQAVAVSGNYAYVADGLAGLWVVDVSNPSMPVTAENVKTKGYASAVVISGDRLYLATPPIGILVFDISVPLTPIQIADITLQNEIINTLDISQNHLYAPSAYHGVWIIEVDSLYQPIGYISTNVAAGVEVVGDYAYVAEGPFGLRIIDVSIPAYPRELNRFKFECEVGLGSISSNYAYVLCSSRTGQARLLVFDLSRSPYEVSIVGSYQFDHATEVTVSGKYAYVISSPIQVLDVSSPANPRKAGSFLPEGAAAAYHTLGFNGGLKVAVADKNIYLPFGHNGFYIFQNELITSAADNKNNRFQPRTFSLEQNYPNPFSSHTAIAYSLPITGHVSLEIYNLLGQRVRILNDEMQSAGQHQIRWNGMDDHSQQLPNGLYVYRLTAGRFYATQKMLYLR